MGSREVFKIFVFLALALMIVPNISAVETVIKVSTYTNHDIELDILKPSPVQLIEVIKKNVGSEGEIVFNFSTEESIFDINAFVKNGNTIVLKQRFDKNTPGESIHLILLPGKIEIIKNFEQIESIQPDTPITSNDTSVNETTFQETTESETTSITGLATSDAKSDSKLGKIFSGKNLYYIVGFIFLFAVIFVVIMKFRRRGDYPASKEDEDVKVKKLSEVIADRKSRSGDYNRAIEDAERKIDEARAEINTLKNAEKIEELKRKLIEDQRELMRLRSGR